MAASPLVRSVHNICWQLNDPTRRRPDIRVSHGRAVFEAKASNSPLIGGEYKYQCQNTHTVKSSVHVFVRYQVTQPVSDTRWRYGLRAKDFPEALWAVTPYSFLVDRVFDVSSLVKALTNLGDPSVVILGSGYVVKNDVTTRHQVSGVSTTNPNVTFTGHGETVVSTDFTMERAQLSPNIMNIIPRIKPMGLVSDLTKLADVVSILRSMLR